MDKRDKYGFYAGSVLGILEVLLIYFFDATASKWLLVQSGIAWFVTSWIIIKIETKLNPILHGILLALLINLPWFINFGVLSGKAAEIVPMIIQSAVFGAGLGFVKKKSAS